MGETRQAQAVILSEAKNLGSSEIRQLRGSFAARQ